MKFTLAFLSAAFAVASARQVSVSDIKADSKFGKGLLSKARKMEEDQVDTSWVPNMSVKFIGCHHISQWNPDADGEDDVRMETKRLAIFRLCPSDTCSSSVSKGCSSGYGDYIVDMDEFLLNYLENKEEVEEATCESYAESGNCDCEDGDDKDDNFDGDECMNDCYKNAGLNYCVEQKYYDNYGEEVEKFDAMEYTECAQYQPNENRRRHLEENGYYEEEEVAYYIGAYCGNEGSTINLGMFTDDTCTEYVDDNTQGRSTFYDLEGEALPYGSQSIVKSGCVTCEIIQEEGAYYDEYYVAQPNDFCAAAYTAAGKCETNLNNEDVSGNTNACNYIEAVKTTSSANGVINSGDEGANTVASAFISIFGISFVMLGSYVYYLKTKLDRGQINLSD